MAEENPSGGTPPDLAPLNERQPTTPSVATPAVTAIPPSRIEIDKFKWVAPLSSLIVISAAAAYLIGFIVVNSYLFKYGMVPYDFLQPRYISAGLLYLTSSAGFTSIIFLLIYLARNKHFLGDTANAELKSAWAISFVLVVLGPNLDWLLPKSENIEGWLSSLRYPAVILAIFMFMLNTTVMPIPQRLPRFDLWWRKYMWEKGWLSWVVLWLVMINCLARLGYAFAFYPVFVFGIWMFISGFRPDQTPDSGVSENANGLVYGITNLFLSIFMYGTLTYPLISPHVGGGKPLLVSLSIKPENRRIIGRIMGREDWKCVMHNISLIHENSEMIYILPNGYYADESAIAIPKNEIVTIAYQKQKKDEHATCVE